MCVLNRAPCERIQGRPYQTQKTPKVTNAVRKAYRDTRQRHAIKRALEEAGRPLGPKEILASASRDVPNLGIATVYRNIKTMVEQGELEPVDLPGQAPRYQKPSDKPQHLFICEKTDSVYTIEPEISSLDPKLPEGFKADRVQVIVYGEKSGGKKRGKKN